MRYYCVFWEEDGSLAFGTYTEKEFHELEKRIHFFELIEERPAE